MKLKLTLIAAALSFSATSSATLPSINICKRKIANFEVAYNHVENHFKVGEVTKVDVARAQIALQQARLQCADVTRTDFCAVVVPAAQLVFDGTLEEAKIGQRTEKEVVDATESYWNLMGDCE